MKYIEILHEMKWETYWLKVLAVKRARQEIAAGRTLPDRVSWSGYILCALVENYPQGLKPKEIAFVASQAGRPEALTRGSGGDGNGAGLRAMSVGDMKAGKAATSLSASLRELARASVISSTDRGWVINEPIASYLYSRRKGSQPISARWGVEPDEIMRGEVDPRPMNDEQLWAARNGTIGRAMPAMYAEIERRITAGEWTLEEGVVSDSRAYSGVRKAHDGTEASIYKPRPSEPAAPVLTANQLHMQKLREDREKMRVRLPARPADGSKIFSNEEGAMFMTMSPEFILNDLSAEQEEAFNAWTDKRIEEAAEAEAATATTGDGVSLYSVEHPDGPMIADDVARETIEETEDGCPNDPDDAPDDIDVIYPTEDELAAIMRGEVVGPAAPEGFDTDPADEG